MAKYENTVQNADGEVVEGATVHVYDNGGTTPASLFTDAALTISETNPLTTDSSGKYEFYIASGLYRIDIEKSGFSSFSTDDVQIGTSDDVWSFETDVNGDLVIRDVSTDLSAIRIEPGSSDDILVIQGDGNVSLFGDNDASDGEGVLSIGEATSAPGSAPTGGAFVWVEDDEIMVQYPNGDEFQLGPFLTNQIPYYGEYHPDKPMPNTDRRAPQSDEFIDGGTASWSWGNQGSATLTEEMDTHLLSIPSSGGTDDIHGRFVSFTPTVDFVVFGKFTSLTEAVNNHFGLAFLTGTLATPTEIVTGGLRRDSSIMDLASGVATSYTALGSLSLNQFSSSHLERGPVYIAMRYTFSTKVVRIYGSVDGMTWSELTVTKTMADHPDFIGFFGNSESSSAFDVRCHWVRTSEDTTVITELVTGR